MPVSDRTTLVGVIVLIAILMVSCGKSDKEEGTSTRGAIPVEVQTLRHTTLTETLSAVGTVEAWHDVTVSSESSGKVVAIYADEGDHRKKGEVIIGLDDEMNTLMVAQSEAQLLIAKAGYEKAKRDLKRSEELFGTKGISESQVEMVRLQAETAESSLKSAQVALDIARRQLRDTRIRSPIDGKVAERYVDIGEMVGPGTPVAVMVDIRHVKVKISVSEEDVSKLRVGQMVHLTVDAYPDEFFEGKISKVGLKADFRTRSFPVEIEVPQNPDEKLKPGMIARIEVEIRNYKDLLLVPQDALIDRSGWKIGYVVINDKAVERSVVLGRQWETQVEVEGGLREDDQLVVTGQENLKDGVEVEVR